MDGKILILEDDEAYAEMLVDTLDANDIPAEFSLDPLEAIERVREGEFSILVSDYLMPKLEGTAFIRRVREFNQTVPVIMISAYMGEAELKQAAEAGVTRILSKPFEISELIGEIRKLTNEDQAPLSKKTGKGVTSDFNHSYPEPLRFIQAGTLEGQESVQNLWEAYETGNPVFISGDRGFELDPIAAELATWNDAQGGTIAFDFRAADLLSGHTRSLINRFAGNGEYSKVVIGRDIDSLDRSQQRMLTGIISRDSSFLRQGGKVTFVFPIETDRLSLAELSMDEDLLEKVFGNLVRVTPLKSRYRDIASYLQIRSAVQKLPELNLSPEAVVFLLRYDWPGNYEQLIELRHRMGKQGVDRLISAEEVRAALEKRGREPIDMVPDPSLAEVLRARQNEILGRMLQAQRKEPKEVLEIVGCPDDAPALNFPSDQELLFPALLDAIAEE